MKIAYVNDTYYPTVNGVVVAIENSTQLLGKQHEVRLYVPSCKMKNSIRKEGNVVVERYASVPLPVYKDFQIVMLDFFRFNNSLDKFNPDIVHIHSPGVIGIAAMIWAVRKHKPVISTYHALLAESSLAYVSPYRLMPWINMLDKGRSGMGENLPKKAMWKIFNPFFNRSTLVIAPAKSAAREAVKHGIRRPVEVVSNGMDLDLFPAKEKYQRSGRIIHVGRLGYEKNIDMVIKMFAILTKKYPKLVLDILGDGPARKSLTELAYKLGIAERVNFEGWKERKSLGEWYRRSDVFVTASGMETQGLVILEAMLSGLPVVGFDKYAIPDMVKNGITGYVVPMGKWKEMADKVEEILEDEKLQERMGREGRKQAEKHDVRICVKRLEKIYQRIIDQSKKSGEKAINSK